MYQATRFPDQIFTTMKTTTLKTRQNIFPFFFIDSTNIQKPCLLACITTTTIVVIVAIMIKSDVQQAVPNYRKLTL
jgi:hypothetical protein